MCTLFLKALLEKYLRDAGRSDEGLKKPDLSNLFVALAVRGFILDWSSFRIHLGVF